MSNWLVTSHEKICISIWMNVWFFRHVTVVFDWLIFKRNQSSLRSVRQMPFYDLFIEWTLLVINIINVWERKSEQSTSLLIETIIALIDLPRFSASVEGWWINYLSLFLFLHVIDDWKPIHWTDSTEILFLPPFNLVPRQCHWPVRFSYRKPSHIRQISIFAIISIFKSKRGRKSKRPCDILVWDESYVSEVSACRR